MLLLIPIPRNYRNVWLNGIRPGIRGIAGRFEFQLKPAFFEVKRLLIEEWRMRGKAITDSDSRICFCGFAGDYTVTVILSDEATIN